MHNWYNTTIFALLYLNYVLPKKALCLCNFLSFSNLSVSLFFRGLLLVLLVTSEVSLIW